MKNRVKLVRKEKGLTQQAFAELLNISKSTVESIEYGRRDVSDRTFKDICRVFHVNETWLRTGEGEMFQEKTREVEIAEMTAAMAGTDPTDLKYQFMRLIAEMTPEQIHMFKELGQQLQQNMQEAEDKAAASEQ